MRKIGIIGFGNMGKAIAERAKSLYEIIVFDKDISKTEDVQNINVAQNNIDLIGKVEAIILAVKPQEFENLLNEIKYGVKDKLLISIAAGITTRYIEKILGKVRVIRVMPNMPAQIGQGISCICRGKFSQDRDLDFTWQLLSCIGETLILKGEDMMDAATAISGSGPAYFCYFIKDKANIAVKRNEFIHQLTEAAMTINFDKNTAYRLSRVTVDGTIYLLKELDLSCKEIIKRVASKGGTTEAALAVLERSGSLERAVKAAVKRAKELSKE